MEHISIDEFLKVKIKIGTILSAIPMEGSEKLLKLSVDLGEETPRQILSGIAKYVNAEELIGKQVPFVTNLMPRVMMGEESNGMLFAGEDEDGIVFLSPERPVKPGVTLF